MPMLTVSDIVMLLDITIIIDFIAYWNYVFAWQEGEVGGVGWIYYSFYVAHSLFKFLIIYFTKETFLDNEGSEEHLSV